MNAGSLRRQFLLSTTMLVAGLSGYGRRAYAACDPAPAPLFECSGAETTQQTIINDDAEVVTLSTPAFSVVTADPTAVSITGDGALSYTDVYYSPLTAATTALYIRSTGDVPLGNPGSVTVNTNGTITGDALYGIYARNDGSGALSVTADGDVEGTGNAGIVARNFGTDLDVNSGAGTTVSGGLFGIRAFNFGSGALTVTANGVVNGPLRTGIYAQNGTVVTPAGTDLSVTTGVDTTVTGGYYGIRAFNYGSGALTVSANGDVTATDRIGIYARNYGTDLGVTTGADTNVTGGNYGIRAFNVGTGALTVTANGDVEGTNGAGIYARNSPYGTDLSVTTGASTAVTGAFYGIRARNYGTGALTVTANGDVTGNIAPGIHARNSPNGTDLSVTTGANTTVSGSYGIRTYNQGTGALTVTANGDVTGTNGSGILATNTSNATGLSVISGAGTTVSGTFNGIWTRNYGGALTVTANGDVTGTSYAGIYARNSGTDLGVTTGADMEVTGGNFGILTRNYGSGALSVTADGDVEGTNGVGIFARNSSYGTELNVTTGADTNVTGGNYGIFAGNYGSGALAVTADGDVTGTNSVGIYAQNSIYGTELSVTTGADTTVQGGNYGIRARNFGSGALTVTADGDVEGTNSTGIYARNYGTDLDVTTGAGTNVTGANYGIRARNYGSGALNVTANGDVEGTNLVGIDARNYGTDLGVTTGAGTTVTGSALGIVARNGGSGALTVTTDGDVTGTNNTGIYARNFYGTDLSVTTGAGTNVTGGNFGITARNYGSGALTVTADGDVTGTGSFGIEARNSSDGTDLGVTTGAGTNVTGGNWGIRAFNYGSGAVTVTVNGDVTGANNDGIEARNFAGTALDVTTGASTTVTGGQRGIIAGNYGSGALSVTANGDVTGISFDGIFARNYGTDLDVTTGVGTNVAGGNYGIRTFNDGSGALTVTANGDVTGTAANSTGIYARNSASGTYLSVTANGDATGSNYGIFARNYGTDLGVTTGTGTTAQGRYGIRATNYGSGILTVTADGDVIGTNNAGISARSFGTGTLGVTTGTGTTVSGYQFGIRANHYGSGALTVTTNGDVTGAGFNYSTGIYARHFSGGPIDITVGATSAVTSNGSGFAIRTSEGPSDVTVAGTLNGGTGGAVQFDQTAVLNDRFALETTAVINGNVFGGLGTDTLALQGTGIGSFDAGQLVDFEAGEKTGTSTWTLTGTNTQITDFAVNDGTLFVNGSLANAAFTVNAGTLGGIGTIGNLTVMADAVFAPGNSIGTITANGNLLFNAGAIYEVEVNAAGQGDQTIVFGTVNLTGSVLRVLAEDGTYNISTDYIIIDNDGADAVTGTFGTVTSNLAFLTPSVVYNGGDGNDVVLTLVTNIGPGSGQLSFCSVAQTPNQCNVGHALDQFPTDNPLFLAVLNQTAAGARQAFDALSGEIHATIPGVLADDSRYLREAVLGRLAQATYSNGTGQVAALGSSGPQVASLDAKAMALGYDDKSLATPAHGPGIAFWARGYGAWGDFDGNNNAATAERDLGGIVSGLDARVSGTWRLGFATGYSKSDVSVAARHSSADVESFHLAGYSGGMAGPVALRGGGAWSWNEVDTSRAVIFPGFFEREKADYDADTGQIFGELAYPIARGRSAFEPFAGLAYVSIDSGVVKENGALAALRGSADDLDVGYSTLGLRAGFTMAWNSVTVTPHVSAAWQHAFDDVTTGAALAFASTGIGFTVTGVPLAEDTALIEAGLDLGFGANTTAGVSYSGQVGDNVEDNAVQGRFAWRF